MEEIEGEKSVRYFRLLQVYMVVTVIVILIGIKGFSENRGGWYILFIVSALIAVYIWERFRKCYRVEIYNKVAFKDGVDIIDNFRDFNNYIIENLYNDKYMIRLKDKRGKKVVAFMSYGEIVEIKRVEGLMLHLVFIRFENRNSYIDLDREYFRK